MVDMSLEEVHCILLNFCLVFFLPFLFFFFIFIYLCGKALSCSCAGVLFLFVIVLHFVCSEGRVYFRVGNSKPTKKKQKHLFVFLLILPSVA